MAKGMYVCIGCARDVSTARSRVLATVRVVYTCFPLVGLAELSTALSWLGLCKPEENELVKVQLAHLYAVTLCSHHTYGCA